MAEPTHRCGTTLCALVETIGQTSLAIQGVSNSVRRCVDSVTQCADALRRLVPSSGDAPAAPPQPLVVEARPSPESASDRAEEVAGGDAEEAVPVADGDAEESTPVNKRSVCEKRKLFDKVARAVGRPSGGLPPSQCRSFYRSKYTGLIGQSVERAKTVKSLMLSDSVPINCESDEEIWASTPPDPKRAKLGEEIAITHNRGYGRRTSPRNAQSVDDGTDADNVGTDADTVDTDVVLDEQVIPTSDGCAMQKWRASMVAESQKPEEHRGTVVTV